MQKAPMAGASREPKAKLFLINQITLVWRCFQAGTRIGEEVLPHPAASGHWSQDRNRGDDECNGDFSSSDRPFAGYFFVSALSDGFGVTSTYTLALMTGALLIVFKLLSDALTAGSGILGLLTEFKDERKKITRNGKIALSGILAGFLLSAGIAYLEARRADAERTQHASEIDRLSRPLDDHINARLVLSALKDGPRASQFRPQLVRYFRGKIDHHVKPDPSIPLFLPGSTEGEFKYFVASHKLLPAAFRSRDSALGAVFDQSVEYSAQLFRSASCDSLSKQKVAPDLELSFADTPLEKDSSAEWEYISTNDYLALSRSLKLWVYKGTTRLTSIEDFPGTTVVVWLGFADRETELDYFEIRLRGESFEATRFTRIEGAGGSQFEMPDNARKLKGRRFQGYCYSIPAA
jgi:hypothetical protein